LDDFPTSFVTTSTLIFMSWTLLYCLGSTQCTFSFAENQENSRESLSLDLKKNPSQNNQKVKLKKVQIKFNIATKNKN
jgi:hypothetical protein